MKRALGRGNTAVGSCEPVRASALVAVADRARGIALRRALEARGLSLIAITADGREALELAFHYRPDLVVLDFRLRNLDALAALDRLRREAPNVRVLFLFPERDDAGGPMALRIGASGYLDERIPPASLARASVDALAGMAAVSRALATKIIAEWRNGPHPGSLGLRPVASELTRREWEVLDLLSAGLCSAEIAEVLVLSPETIDTHIKNMMRKLDVHSRAAAVERGDTMRQPASPGGERRLGVERRAGFDRRSGRDLRSAV